MMPSQFHVGITARSMKRGPISDAGQRDSDTDAAGTLGMLRPVQVCHVALCPRLSEIRLHRIFADDFAEMIRLRKRKERLEGGRLFNDNFVIIMTWLGVAQALGPRLWHPAGNVQAPENTVHAG